MLGIGPDGRKRYTVDPDARAGHRSATNSRPAGPTSATSCIWRVSTRHVRWTNHVDRTTLGPEVPGVITMATWCQPAPSRASRRRRPHRGEERGQNLTEVVWDPGYSLCQPGTTAIPLPRPGITQTFQPVTHQRGTKPFSGEALLIDGQLFSPHLPEALRDLPAPPRGATEEEKLRLRGQVQPAGPLAPRPPRRPRRRRRHPVALPLLCRLLRSRTFPNGPCGGSRRAPLVRGA